MAQTPNPTASVGFSSGSYRPELILSENVVLKIGTAIAGPYLVPQRATQLASVLGYLHGPLVRSAAHHVGRGGACILVRCRTTTPGTTGSVTKLPAAASLGTVALSLQSYTLHAQVAGGAALALSSGWTAPPAPLPLRITSGVGTVAHVQTVTYRDEAGAVQTAAVSISAAGVTVTSFEASQIISITSNIDPVGTQDYAVAFAGPNDRYQIRLKTITGGQVGVTGATTPRVQLSLDDGRTYSRTMTLPSSGLLELRTYAGGQVPQPTGLLATYSASGLTSTVYGALRVAGATVNGDVMYSFKAASVTVTHTVPVTNSAALGATVVGTDVTISGATNSAGVRAFKQLTALRLNTVFELATQGTAGNAVTIRTVTGGAAAVSAIGNAVTITYVDGVTTVANIEALFPVAVTAGSVRVKTAGTGGNVLADPGDTIAATNLAGGANAVGTSTAADVVSYLLTSSDAGAIAARALLNPVAIGTGLGLIAAAASAGAANGGLVFTALAEGVQVRLVASGVSSALRLANVNGLITIYTATDADGASTSTPNAIIAKIATDATISLLIAATATGTGAGLAGTLGSYFALAVSFATGDVFTADTTPPAWSTADLAEVFVSLLKNQTALTLFGFLHVIGDADQAAFAAVDQFAADLHNQRRQFKHAWIEGAYMVPGAVETTWKTGLLSAFTTTSDFVGICAGETLVSNDAYGTTDRLGAATPILARLAICPVSELPSHVDCETNLGTRFALDGVQMRSTDGSTPPLFQSDDTLQDLHAAGFSTLTTHSNRTGIYVRQAMMFAQNGSNFIFATQRRVADVAAAVTYDTILRKLNANLIAVNGYLSDIERDNLARDIEEAVRKQLMGGPRQHITAVAASIDDNPSYSENGRITGTVAIVGRTPATTINFNVAYAKAV